MTTPSLPVQGAGTSAAPNTELHPIRPLLAEFRDAKLERDYRKAYLAYESRQIVIFVLFFLPVIGVFVVSDFALFEESGQLRNLMLVRLLILAVGLVVLLAAWRQWQSAVLDFTTFAFIATGSLATAYIDSTRPPDYMGHFTYDVITIMAIYYAFPIPLRYLAVSNLIFTAALLWLFYTAKEPRLDLYWTLVPVCLMLANGFGYVGARRIRMYHRGQYLVLLSEQSARAELQEALQRIRTLSGLIPICASCKKIRDDQGFWNQLEAYVSKHSEATFTHGICPECFSKFQEDAEGLPGRRATRKPPL